ncbi:MAG: glycosyltransferase [Acidobacteriia bacterium]|nr:glycosyltransferase [Terriglobia bacterium]
MPCRPLPFDASSDPLKPRQLVFFGRLETRKGFALFASAVRRVRESLAGLDRIVLLGPQDESGAADRMRRELGDLAVEHIADLDSDGAAHYLHAHRRESLVVIPSPVENFPYAVIETSLIPGLQALYSSGGGVPEIFRDSGGARLFDPHPEALAGKILERWYAPADDAVPYDFAAANARWLRFHEKALAARRDRVSIVQPDARNVDVCITYFNKREHFPELLDALDRQTAQGFGVIAVDDGSSDADARDVFDAMAAKYAPRGWTFFRQKNAFVDAARNQAAAMSDAPYLLFIDADDLPAPDAVRKMLSAALVSGDDCLIAAGCFIEGESVKARYMPLGPDLAGGLIDPIVFGPSMILIRRAVFQSVGGYRQVRGAAHEDWELQVRLLLDGYKTDVIPEFLLRFRQLPDGLALTSDEFAAKRRLIEAYEERFARIGLHGAASLMVALYRRCQELEKAAREQVPLGLRLRLHERVRQMLSQKPPA